MIADMNFLSTIIETRRAGPEAEARNGMLNAFCRLQPERSVHQTEIRAEGLSREAVS